MTLFESLLKQYGVNEPIFFPDISFQGYSQQWIEIQLEQLCVKDKIRCYETGIYYIPTNTLFGKSLLNPRKVIEGKYIYRNGITFGYYSGIAFQHQLRLTTQVPNVIEICTNNVSIDIQEVYVGKQKVVLHKARTEITAANAATLCFLELISDLTPDRLDGEKKEILIRFAADRKITRKDVVAYAPLFPHKSLVTLIANELIK